MRHFLLAVASLLTYLASLVTSTALTYRLQPNEKACFFAWVNEKGAKAAFYFAVRLFTPSLLLDHVTFALLLSGPRRE